MNSHGRVGIIAYQLSDHGGTKQRLDLWSKHLFDENFDIIFSERKSKSNAFSWYGNDKNKFTYYQIPSSRSRVISYILFFIHLAKHLNRDRYDYVMPVGTASELLTAIIVRFSFSKTKLIVYRAGSPVPVKLLGTYKGNVLRLLLTFVYGQCEKIVSINKYLAALLSSQFRINKSKIVVIPISVNPDFSMVNTLILDKMPITANIVRFGMLTRLTKEKGVDTVLESLSTMGDEFLSMIKLDIYGEGSYRNELERRVEELNLSDVISFRGWVSDQFSALASVDCLIVASELEGTPRCILEAGALAIPSIASSVGGIPEMLEHEETGWLFNYGDVSALNLIFSSILTDHTKLKSVGLNFKKIVTLKYTIDREVVELREQLEIVK